MKIEINEEEVLVEILKQDIVNLLCYGNDHDEHLDLVEAYLTVLDYNLHTVEYKEFYSENNIDKWLNRDG